MGRRVQGAVQYLDKEGGGTLIKRVTGSIRGRG